MTQTISPTPARSAAPRPQNGAAPSSVAHAADQSTIAAIHDVVQDGVVRAIVTAGLGAMIVMHAVDGVAKWSETRYIFWMYMAAIAASLVCGAVLLFSRSAARTRLALLAAAGIAGSVFLGYVVSRTTGMPNATDDIGNWTEPLGLASIVTEGVTVLAALGGWAAIRRRGA